MGTFVNRLGAEFPVEIVNHETHNRDRFPTLHVLRVRFQDGTESELRGFDQGNHLAVTPHICADTDLDCKVWCA